MFTFFLRVCSLLINLCPTLDQEFLVKVVSEDHTFPLPSISSACHAFLCLFRGTQAVIKSEGIHQEYISHVYCGHQLSGIS